MGESHQTATECEPEDEHEPSDWLLANERHVLQRIGERIAKERGERSQRWLSDFIGTNQTSIRRLERGESSLSAVLLARAAKVLNLDLQELMSGIEPEVTLVDQVYEEHQDSIEQRTSAMGLGELDFHTKRELLRLLKLWPK